jgi:hypothetical protein
MREVRISTADKDDRWPYEKHPGAIRCSAPGINRFVTLVIEEACQKYVCENGCILVTAAKPMAPIEKGLPGPGLLAHVAVNKYGDHLPLHRQEAIFRRQGVALSRKTMCDWMYPVNKVHPRPDGAPPPISCRGVRGPLSSCWGAVVSS